MARYANIFRGSAAKVLVGIGLAALAVTAGAQMKDFTVRPPQAVSWNGDPSAPDMSGPWVLSLDTASKADGRTASKEGWKSWPPQLKGKYAEIWKKRVAEDAAGTREDDPVNRCVPTGMPRFVTGIKTPMLIIQSKQRVTIFRSGEAPRRVWLDGRPFPAHEDLELFLKGTAIGHYDGQALVIETRGIKDLPIDSTGIPHSDKMVVFERWSRVDAQTLRVELKVVDPEVLVRPLTSTLTYKAVNDPLWEPKEFICTPNTDYHPEVYVR